MKKIFFAVILVVFVFGISGETFANRRFVSEEAARRNMKLISIQDAEEIVEKKFAPEKVSFKEIDLDNEADDYPNSTGFRPVYQIECFSEGREYDIDVDAVTGEILKFKLDD